MMALLLESALLAALVAPLVALVTMKRPGGLRWGALFLLLLFIDATLTGLPPAAGLRLPDMQWNWFGKLLSLGWAIAFVASGPLSRSEVGAVVRQREGSLLPASIVVVLLLALTAVLVGGGGARDMETLLFQATMPGFAEELVYRGVLLALLDRASTARVNIVGARMGWGIVVTSIAFGAWHGVSLSGSAVTFDSMAFLFPFLGGLVFGWLRERTGSLLMPIVAHNGANLVHHLLA